MTRHRGEHYDVRVLESWCSPHCAFSSPSSSVYTHFSARAAFSLVATRRHTVRTPHRSWRRRQALSRRADDDFQRSLFRHRPEGRCHVVHQNRRAARRGRGTKVVVSVNFSRSCGFTLDLISCGCGSSATRNESDSGTEKLRFSKPMTPHHRLVSLRRTSSASIVLLCRKIGRFVRFFKICLSRQEL